MWTKGKRKMYLNKITVVYRCSEMPTLKKILEIQLSGCLLIPMSDIISSIADSAKKWKKMWRHGNLSK